MEFLDPTHEAGTGEFMPAPRLASAKVMTMHFTSAAELGEKAREATQQSVAIFTGQARDHER